MPITAHTGIVVPTGSDDYALTADMLRMARTTGAIIPVPNTSARATLVTAASNAGYPVSASNPLTIFRADAAVGFEHEYTTDGTTWRKLVPERRIPEKFTTSNVAWASGAGEVPLASVGSNLTLNGGRVYGIARAFLSIDTAPAVIRIKAQTTTGVELGQGQIRLQAAGGGGQEDLTFPFEGALVAGTYTIQLRGEVINGSGTATLIAGSSIHVTDVAVEE